MRTVFPRDRRRFTLGSRLRGSRTWRLRWVFFGLSLGSFAVLAPLPHPASAVFPTWDCDIIGVLVIIPDTVPLPPYDAFVTVQWWVVGIPAVNLTADDIYGAPGGAQPQGELHVVESGPRGNFSFQSHGGDLLIYPWADPCISFPRAQGHIALFLEVFSPSYAWS